MSIIVTEFLPLMIGALLVPVPIVIVLLLLRDEGGLLKAAAFVAGQTAVRLLQGIVFGFLYSGSSAAQTSRGSAIIVDTLLLVLGILLLIAAYRKWIKQEDPDAPPPKWMAMFGSISGGKTFLFGMGLLLISAKQWVFTLGALGVIREAQLASPQDTFAYLIFVLGAQSLVLVPIVAVAVAPKQSSPWILSASEWLERHNRRITIAVSLVFGVYFAFKGISGLFV